MSQTGTLHPEPTPQTPAAGRAAPQPLWHAAWFQAAAIFLLALLVRGAHFFLMRDSLLYETLICDAWAYDQWAQKVAGGQWIGTEVFYQTPLYPYLLGVIYALVGHSVWAVRIVQAVFGALSCVFLAQAGNGYFSRRVGWLAGIFLAVYPSAVFFDGILQKSSLDLLLISALLWATSTVQQRPTIGRFTLVGALLGAFTLNRENAALLIPVVLVWIAWQGWQRLVTAPWRSAAACLVGVAGVLVPVAARNYYVGGAFLPTTSQMGPNFFIGNHSGANGFYESLRPDRGDPRYESQDAKMLAEEDLGHELTSAEVSSYWMGRALADIRENPSEWLRLVGWKFLLTWNKRELVDAEAISTHALESPLLGWLEHGLHFGVLCPLAALGLWWTIGDWRKLWLLYAIVASFALAVTLFYVMARYRYPLVAPLTLFAAAGVVGLWDLVRARTSAALGELITGLLLCAPVAIVSNWSVPLPFKDDAVTFLNAGTTLLDMNRVPDALTILKRANEADPSFSLTYYVLGRALLLHGDLPNARICLDKAIRLHPGHSAFYLSLGEVALAEKKLDEAAEHFREAIRKDAFSAQAHQFLARVEDQQGRKDGAITLYRRAVRLDPRSAPMHADLGVALLAAGQTAEALDELRTSARLDSNTLSVVNNLGWILATSPQDGMRNGAEAVEWAQQACRLTSFERPEMLDTLAAAWAESGDFEKAIESASLAIELAQQQKQDELLTLLEEHRDLYRKLKPLRDATLEPAAPMKSSDAAPKKENAETP